MPTFKFWYKKEIQAKDIAQAIRLEKKAELKFDSVSQSDECDRELHPCIGFDAYQEDDEYMIGEVCKRKKKC